MLALSRTRYARELQGPVGLLVAVLVGPLMASAYSTMVSVALPRISAQFGADVAVVQWVVLTYLLANSATLMIAGRLGDLLGAARMYRAGLALFVVGGLACAVAPSLPALLMARPVQALGASLFVGVAPALLAGAFPEQRGRVLGLSATATYAGLSLGPLLGGALTEWFDWRAIFVAVLPLGGLALWLAWRWVPVPVGAAPARTVHFDWWGSLAYAAMLAPTLLALTELPARGSTSPMVLGLFALSAAAAVGFIWAERHTAAPVVDLKLFGSRYFALTSLAKTSLFVAMFPTFFLLIPFYLSQVRGLGPGAVGLVLGVQFVAMAVAGPIAGNVTDRMGSTWPATLGMVLMAGVLFTLAQIGPLAPYAVIVLLLALLGTGGAFAEVANTTALMGAVPPARRGMASGTVGTTRFVGQALGLALASSLFAAAGGRTDPSGSWLPYGTTFLVLCAVAVGAALLSLVRGPAPEAAG